MIWGDEIPESARTQHADDFTTNYTRAEHDDYATFSSSQPTYTATERDWTGQDVSVSFTGYYDTPGDLWQTRSPSRRRMAACQGFRQPGQRAVRSISRSTIPRDVMDLLGVKATGNSSANVLTGSKVRHPAGPGRRRHAEWPQRRRPARWRCRQGRPDRRPRQRHVLFLQDDRQRPAARLATSFAISTGSDLIDLQPIDANSARSGNNKFVWIDDAAFSGHAGELRYFEVGHRLPIPTATSMRTSRSTSPTISAFHADDFLL